MAAVIGVLLGAWLFGGRVKDLKGAVDASEKLIRQHGETVRQSLTEMKLSLDDQFSSTLESLGQLRGVVGDLEDAAGDTGPDEAHTTLDDKLRDEWAEIRDTLERIAASPDIDGRTRAKYGRIDRRSYYDLIDALARDGRLEGEAEEFKNAVRLWMQFRNGRRRAKLDDVNKMKQLRERLAKER